MADDDAPPQIDTSQPNPPPDTPTVMPQGPATPPLGQENLGIPSSIQQKATQSARPGVPIVWQLISDMRNAGQPGHPGTRLEGFESFLGNFINALGQGFANEGHGPGAWARGAGAALTAPLNREVAAQQFGSQQAQQQAQTAQTQAQTAQLGNVVQTPFGPMNQQLAARILPGMLGAQAKVQSTQIAQRFKAVPGVGLYDTQSLDSSGNPTLIPGSAQGTKVTPEIALQYGLPDGFVGKTMKLTDFAALERGQAMGNAVVPTGAGPQIVPKFGPNAGKATPVTNSQGQQLPPPQVNQVSVGQLGIAGAKLGLAQKTFERDTFGTLFGNSIPSSLVDASGNAIGWKAPSKPTSSILTQGQQAQDLASLFQTVRQKVMEADASGKLGPYSGRINELMTGKVGADDPQFAELRALGSLTSSGMLKAHFGSRGGQQMYGHFENLFNTGKMTSGDLLGALNGFSTFMNQYATRAATAGQPNRVPSGGSVSLQDLLKAHPPK